MNHVMVDIEALRLNQPWKAPLMQVAAIEFNEYGIAGHSWEVFIHPSTLPAWAEPELQTVEFWENEPYWKDLQNRMSLDGVDPETMMRELTRATQNKVVWFAGPQYDQIALEAYFDNYGIPRPWAYNDIRDFRTIRKQHPKIYDEVMSDRREHHNALADCWYQLEVLREISERHNKAWR